MIKDTEKNADNEIKEEVVDLYRDEIVSEIKQSGITRTIDKTTYVVNLHFKEQGMTFSEVLKRVLKGVG